MFIFFAVYFTPSNFYDISPNLRLDQVYKSTGLINFTRLRWGNAVKITWVRKMLRK